MIVLTLLRAQVSCVLWFNVIDICPGQNHEWLHQVQNNQMALVVAGLRRVGLRLSEE